MAPTGPITTELTKVLGIKHPILLAGMARVSGGLAAGRAAVSNAGGGPRREWRLPSTPPAQLKEFIDEMKGQPGAPTHPDLPFGVGPGAAAGGRRRRRRARPTNDYTDYGKLGVELIELTIGPACARLLFCVRCRRAAPRRVVTLTSCTRSEILVMNMVGHPPQAAQQEGARPGRRHGVRAGHRGARRPHGREIATRRSWSPPWSTSRGCYRPADAGRRRGLAASLMQGARRAPCGRHALRRRRRHRG